MIGTYRDLLRAAAWKQMLAAKVLSRLPEIGFGLATLWLVQRTTGSYAWAGATVAAMSLAMMAVSAPVTGWVERGSGPVRKRRLWTLAAVAGASLCVFPLLAHADAAGWGFCVAAGVFGAADPPVGSLLRAWWMRAVAGRLQQAAHGWENSTTEALYVTGPLVAAVALAVGKLEVLYPVYAVMLLCGVCMYCKVDGAAAATEAEQEAEDECDGQVPVSRQRGLWPALLCAALWIACYDGAVVGLTALAEDRGSAASAGVWVACLSLGGLAGGLLYGVYARPASRLRRELIVGMLLYAALGGVFLLPGWGVAVACVLVGMISAVPFAGVYVWVDERLIGAGRAAAYQAMSAAMCAGGVAGAAGGGALVELVGVRAELLVSGAAAVVAAVVAAAAPRVRTFRHV